MRPHPARLRSPRPRLVCPLLPPRSQNGPQHPVGQTLLVERWLLDERLPSRELRPPADLAGKDRGSRLREKPLTRERASRGLISHKPSVAPGFFSARRKVRQKSPSAALPRPPRPPWKNQAEPSGPASFPRPLWGTGHPGPREISLGRFRKECSFATGDNNREENLPAHVVIGLSPGESRRVKRREDVHRFESQREIKTAAGAASAAGEGPLRGWGAAEAAGVPEGTVPPSAA